MDAADASSLYFKPETGQKTQIQRKWGQILQNKDPENPSSTKYIVAHKKIDVNTILKKKRIFAASFPEYGIFRHTAYKAPRKERGIYQSFLLIFVCR